MCPVPSRQILGLGGYPDEAMARHLLRLARGPRVLFDTTASPHSDSLPELHGAELTPLSFYPWPPSDLRDVVLTHDVVFVGGGNTANLLAVWRAHGFDEILREAWETGILLCGWSAGR